MGTISVISNDALLSRRIIESLSGKHTVLQIENVNRLFEVCFTDTPELILLDIDAMTANDAAIISTIKSDPLFGHLPILVITDAIRKLHAFHLRALIDDFTVTPLNVEDLTVRIGLCMSRAQKILETNPLTRLPGNITIIKEIQKRIDAAGVFALAYADMDHFKPFNDRYGFSRGDEVIRMTGRLITNIIKIRSPGDGFAGHIGGDDFVFIVPFEGVDVVCTEIIANFDEILPRFYDADEREKGYIESLDRDGKRRTYSVISLSIGVAHNKSLAFSHYGQASEIATEMKKYAKTFPGSCYRIDRRLS